MPDSVPFEHERDCETHVEPNGTVEVWYAVIAPPCATLWPLNVQAAGVPALQELFVYEPERVPLEHVRCWLTH